MKTKQLIKMTTIVFFSLLTLSGINVNLEAKAMSVGQIAAVETRQNQPSRTEPVVPFSEVDKGKQEDYTDVFAVPLDNDEADEDLELEELERMGSESRK